jgi:8-oxo-dGTP pyrophosphatase MutT (NUDIX family)
MLSIVKVTKKGETQYTVGGDQTPTGDTWSIKNPPEDFTYPNTIKRFYNGIPYLLSEKAAKSIPTEDTEYHGCTCIIQVENAFVMVTDKKFYVQNCTGKREPHETDPRETMKREIKEELDIEVTHSRLKEIGYLSILRNYDIVDSKLKIKFILFFLNCFKEEFHRITWNFCHLKVVPVNYTEIRNVVIVPFDQLEEAPDYIKNKNFGGHHREILRMFLGRTKKYNITYLHELSLNFEEEGKDWIVVCKKKKWEKKWIRPSTL